jgi:hypothetical protein
MPQPPQQPPPPSNPPNELPDGMVSAEAAVSEVQRLTMERLRLLSQLAWARARWAECQKQVGDLQATNAALVAKLNEMERDEENNAPALTE